MNKNSEVSAVKERLKDIFKEKENESESLGCKKDSMRCKKECWVHTMEDIVYIIGEF